MNKNTIIFFGMAALALMVGCNGTSEKTSSMHSSSVNHERSSVMNNSSSAFNSSTINTSSVVTVTSESSRMSSSLADLSSTSSMESVALSSITASSRSNGDESSEGAVGENLVPNGDFSLDPSSQNEKWIVVNQNMSQSDFAWFNRSAILSVSAISSNWWETTFFSPNFVLSKGKRYKASATFSAVNNSQEKAMRFRVRYSGANPFSTNLGEFSVSEVPTTKTFAIEVPDDAPTDNIEAQLLFNLGADENDVKIDDVSVYEIGTPNTVFDITSYKNIRYSERFQRANVTDYPANHSPNVLDIHRPNNNNVYPGLVLVHGGAWRFAGKSKLEVTAKELAAKGYVVANIHYQLSTKMTPSFPEAVIDVKSAIRWFRGNAQFYNLNPQKVAGIGGSAGGNLIAMAATTSEINDFDGDVNNYSDESDRLQATIVLAGGMDQEYRLRVTDPSAVNNEYVKNYLGIENSAIQLNNNQHLKLLRQASPIHHANSQMGPILLIESRGDVPNAPQGRYPSALYEKLDSLNVYNEYKRMTPAKHSKWDSDPSIRAAYMLEYDRFLKQHLH